MSRRRTGVLAGLLALAAALTLSPAPSAQSVPPPPIHFSAAGDYGNGNYSSMVLNGIAASGADLDLALGDLSYAATGTEQAYCDFVTSRLGAGFPFQVVSGNHESN